MSEVFEKDIDQMDERELLSLEDDNNEYHDSAFDGKFVYPSPLFKVKLEYSSEGVYVTAKPEFNLQAGDYVYITGTMYVARDAAHKRIAASIEKGENLFEVDTAYAEDKLYSVFSYIEEIEVSGRKRTYQITRIGLNAYQEELERLNRCLLDAQKLERS